MANEAWVRERAAYYGVSVESLKGFLDGNTVEVMPAPPYAKATHECTCWPSGDTGHDPNCPIWEK